MKLITTCLCLGLALVLSATAACAEDARLQRSVVTVPTEATVQQAARVYHAGTGGMLHPRETQKLKFTVAVYGWLSSVTGESWTDGVATDVDIGFDQITEHVNTGFMGYAEMRWGKWTFALDSYVSELEGPIAENPLFHTDFVINSLMLDLRVGYTVWKCTFGQDRWRGCIVKRKAALDLVVGARYWNNKISLKLDSPILPGPGLEPSTRDEWVDPYLGLRFRSDLAKRWFVAFYGDVGGFSIGDASTLTWQIQAGVGFKLTPRLYLMLGYRALEQDRTEDTGLLQLKNGTDLLTHGPIIGAGYLF